MILTLVALAAGGGLLGLAAAIQERRHQAPAPAGGACGLPDDPDPGAPGAVTAAGAPAEAVVVVLLPVRDEAANIRETLAALLALDGAPAIVVIDDGSSDGTRELAATAASQDRRLTVLGAGELPAGWRGKVHALSVGSRGTAAAAAEWLLLTDADVRMRPPALAAALAAARRWQLDAVSLAGRQEAHGLVENLLVPAVFALLDDLLGDWRQAASGGGSPVANGQFILVRRAAWEASGGFAAIQRESIDDVALARGLRQHGYRTSFFRAPDLLSVRMYRGWREAIRGWRRNLGGLLGARWRLGGAILGILAAPPLLLLGALAAGRGGPAVVIWSAGAAASSWLRAGARHNPLWGLLYPLDALLLAAVLAGGFLDWRRRRLLSWKGREIRL